MTYDPNGQMTSITDPLGNATTFQYDGRGLVTQTTDPLGRSWQMNYDAAGNLLSVTDAANRTTTMAYDLLGRMTSLVDAINGTTAMTYDAAGNLTSMEDPTGRSIQYAYDSLDRTTGITYPDGGLKQYEYDQAGNMSAFVDSRNQRTDWTFDAIGRPLSQKIEGEATSTFVYDEVDNLIKATLDNGDGTGLEIINQFIEGINGYPTAHLQTATGMPLTATLDFAYGSLPYLRDLSQPALPANQGQSLPDVIRPQAPGAQVCSQNLPSVITQTLVLTDTSGAYCFGESNNSTTSIEAGVSVTVEPGVTLAGRSESNLEVLGSLVFSGAVNAPAILTAQSGTSTINSNYSVIVLGGGHIEFRQAQMWYAARCNFFGCVQLALADDATGILENSHLGLGTNFSLLYTTNNSALTIHDSVLADPEIVNDKGILRLDSTGALSVTNTIFLHQPTWNPGNTPGIRVNERNVAGLLDGGNVFSLTPGSPSRIFVTATFDGLNADAIWKGLDQSVGLEGLFFFLSGLNIHNDATLVVEGPQDIIAWHGWNVGNVGSGHLRLRGRPDAPIDIHGYADDFDGISVFGNSSFNSTLEADYAIIRNKLGTARSGNISIFGGSSAVISHTLLTGGIFDGIYVSDSQLNLFESQIVGNARHGIFFAASSGFDVTLRDNVIVGNGANGVMNQTPLATTIDAAYNFWGAANGPTHPSNLAGTGQTVSDGVTFDPWLPIPGDGRMSGLRLVSNNNQPQEEAFNYNPAGYLTELSTDGYSDFSVAFSYDNANRLLSRTLNSSIAITNTFAHDAANRLTNMAVAGPNGSLLDLSYSYDSAGYILNLDSSLAGNIAYTYDELNRLISVNIPGTNAAYSYDAAGNRLSAGSTNFTYDAAGRLISSSDAVSYNYDAAGNLSGKTVAGQTTNYTWDGQNRLSRIDFPDGSFSAYRYDDFGRRISKLRPDGASRYYIYFGDMLAQELDESGNVIASYTYEGLDRPISMWRDGHTYYYLLDHLGSALGLVDGSGTITATYQYDPWGVLVSSTGNIENPLRFTAREYDEESGLYYVRARYYDPAAGRFISRDPLGIDAGLNLYAYVFNNPVSLIDPSGTQVVNVIRAFGRGVLHLGGQLTNHAAATMARTGGASNFFAHSQSEARALAERLARMQGRGGGRPRHNAKLNCFEVVQGTFKQGAPGKRLRVFYDSDTWLIDDLFNALPSFSGSGIGKALDVNNDGRFDFNDMVDLINPLPFSIPFETMEQLMNPNHGTGGIPLA